MPYPDVIAIHPHDGPLEAVVHPPGSKSLTNRALVVASLASGGVSHLGGALEAGDTAVMRQALRELGVMIDDADDPWLVLGSAGDLVAPRRTLDAGASGTTARFLTAVAALVPGEVTIDGTPRMRQRPIGELASALSDLGVEVETAGGFPPVKVRGGVLEGGEVTISAARSSQFLSALLLVAPLAAAPLTVRIAPREVVSRPYITGTLEVMAAFGANCEVTRDGFAVDPTGYRATRYEIEADASAAAYPLAAAAICGGIVAVDGIPAQSSQADLAIIDVLSEMGCTVHRTDRRIALAGPSGRLRGVDVDMNRAPDAVLALAAVCLFADGPSRIRNVGNLRLKETDRLAALSAEIRRVGAGAEIEGDDLIVTPAPLVPARVLTYDDHRMAMAFSLVGLRQPGIEIDNPGCVSKTWPGFFDMLEAL